MSSRDHRSDRYLLDTRTTEELFWAKVDKSGSCWVWLGVLQTAGYGNFWFEKRMQGSHRVSWQFSHGPIPSGLFVCHSCDNKLCVRPDHLWLGTAKDNTQDLCLKGLFKTPDRKGERNSQHKLTNKLVQEIRSAKGTASEVAERYGVHRRTVYHVRWRKAWCHIEEQI